MTIFMITFGFCFAIIQQITAFNALVAEPWQRHLSNIFYVYHLTPFCTFLAHLISWWWEHSLSLVTLSQKILIFRFQHTIHSSFDLFLFIQTGIVFSKKGNLPGRKNLVGFLSLLLDSQTFNLLVSKVHKASTIDKFMPIFFG